MSQTIDVPIGTVGYVLRNLSRKEQKELFWEALGNAKLKEVNQDYFEITVGLNPVQKVNNRIRGDFHQIGGALGTIKLSSTKNGKQTIIEADMILGRKTFGGEGASIMQPCIDRLIERVKIVQLTKKIAKNILGGLE